MRKKAFSLIELVLVIVVMAVASLGLAAVFQQVFHDTHRPEVMSVATSLAVKEAERVIRLDFNGVGDEYRDSPQSYTGDFSNYSREVRVDSIDTAQPNLGSDLSMELYKVVEVRVHHNIINYISIKFLKASYS